MPQMLYGCATVHICIYVWPLVFRKPSYARSLLSHAFKVTNLWMKTNTKSVSIVCLLNRRCFYTFSASTVISCLCLRLKIVYLCTNCTTVWSFSSSLSFFSYITLSHLPSSPSSISFILTVSLRHLQNNKIIIEYPVMWRRGKKSASQYIFSDVSTNIIWCLVPLQHSSLQHYVDVGVRYLKFKFKSVGYTFFHNIASVMIKNSTKELKSTKTQSLMKSYTS